MEWLNKVNNDLFTSLTLPQKIYTLAFVLLIIVIFTDDVIALSTVGFVAIVGMAIEHWPKFVATWDNLLGRFLMIIFYAIVANFAVAFAAQKLNSIIGIDPSPLFYSIGFAALLMAPIWMLALSVLGMVIYTLFLQVVILIRLMSKLLRLERFTGKYTGNNRLSFVVLKLVLVIPMFYGLVSAMDVYSRNDSGTVAGTRAHNGQINAVMTQNFATKFGEQVTQFNGKNTSNSDEETTNDIKTPELTSNEHNSQEVENASDNLTPSDVSADNKATIIDADLEITFGHLIAMFVHHVELFQYSQCIKSDRERVLFIGEFDILVSEPDAEQPYGYKFSVRNCELKAF